jgi:hypothetical protein
MKNTLFSSSKRRKQSQLHPPQSHDDTSFMVSSHDGTLGRPQIDSSSSTSILWSAILRNDTVLVEADLGAAMDKEVQQAAKLLLKKPPTPGWEHSTLNKNGMQQAAVTNKGGMSSSMMQDSNVSKLKGMKFHVYEHFPEEEEEEEDQEVEVSNNNKIDAGYGDEWVNYTSPVRKVHRRYKNDGLTIWTYACVYNPTLVDFIQVQSFLEKIVTMTEIFRQPVVRVQGEMKYEPWHQQISSTQRSPQDIWRYGSHHAAQSTFAPVLLQRMEEVSYYGKLAMCHAKVEAVKEIMSRNIDLILEHDERLAIMANEKAAKLNEMAKVFAKNSQKVKRQMLWNNAKHGAIMGAAITAGIAAAIVPVVVIL